MNYQLIYLTILLVSGCVNPYNDSTQKNSDIERQTTPQFFLNTEATGKQILNYETNEGLKSIRPPKVEEFTDSFELNVFVGNEDTLQPDWGSEYLLGNFRSDMFKKEVPFLQIEVSKDGHHDRFIIHYYFDSSIQKFVIKDIYKLDYIYGCWHELGAIYKINDEHYPQTLSETNLKILHEMLFSTFMHKGTKIMPEILLSEYNKLMNNKTQDLAFSLIFTDDESPECRADEYVGLAYYFKEDLDLSYNIANAFHKQGYHTEALILLRRIIQDDPSNIDAYLIIADSYYALGVKGQAIDNYKIYMDKMIYLGQQEQIPQRIKSLVKFQYKYQ